VLGKPIGIERAPEPDDIVWESNQLPMKDSITRKIKYSLLTGLVILIAGFCLFGVAFASKKVSQSASSQFVMNTLFAILVCILNFVIEVFLIFISER
jgi:hypothetical protein